MRNIRLCRNAELTVIHGIISGAAEAYRGVIPADCWHDPYMSFHDLERELAAGVQFWGYELGGELIGVMGFQPVKDVNLLRHAYVLPGRQRGGIGSALIGHLRSLSARRMLVGTWAAATWAIRFYQRHDFQLLTAARAKILLNTYWTITDRQIETSVVLANPAFERGDDERI